MLGMGWPELLLIGVVAVFLFGPDKLPHLAKQAGGALRTVRRMGDNARSDLADELGDDFRDTVDAVSDKLSEEAIIAMNSAVAIDKRSATEVAREFLEANDLL